jgi:hypothetical protein
MNVIILAADAEDNLSENSAPRCLSQFVGNVNLIERQLRVLSLYGINRSSVTVVIGTKGIWSNSKHKDYMLSLGCNIIYNYENTQNRSSHSLMLAFNEVSDLDSSLVISGDLNFDTKHIDTLIQGHGSTKALVREALSIGEKGTLLSCKNNSVMEVGNQVRSSVFPWYVFCGMALVEPGLIKKYKESSNFDHQLSYIDALNFVKSDLEISSIDYVNPRMASHNFSSIAKDLTGGSFASLRKRHLIRKYADEKGAKKLLDEIQWLRDLPDNLKDMFPSVVDHSSVLPDIWFDMPFYDVPNIRKNILNGRFDVQQIMQITESLLDFVFNNLYVNTISDTPSGWIKEKHLDRVEDRLYETIKVAPIFSSIMAAKNISINGLTYENLPALFFRLKNSSSLLNLCTPDKMRMIHGDLHYQNILLTQFENKPPFLLADPRGELLGSDVYYDMGKLWHSFNGMYDLIHTDQHSLQYQVLSNGDIDVNLTLGTEDMVNTYNEVHRFVLELLLKYDFISKDKNWLIKTKFNEVMHFSRVILFHLFNDGIERRGLVLYFVATRLINEFFEEFKTLVDMENEDEQKNAIIELKEFQDSISL